MVPGRKSFLFLAILVIAVLGLAQSEPDVANAQCSDGRILTFTLEPSGVVDSGTDITVRITATCGTTRLLVNGQHKDEIGSPVLTAYIRTEEFPAGTLVFRAEVRDDNDPSNWDGTNNWEQTLVVRSASGEVDTSSPPINSQVTHDMDIWGWCVSMGHSGADYTGDAYSWICTNHDGSRARDIDVDPVCQYSSRGVYPYAHLEDPSDPYSWSCQNYPQGQRPPTDEDSENSDPPSVINNDAPPPSGASCENNISRLSVGMIAVVNNVTPDPALLRNYPTAIASVIAEVPVNTQITIIGGPECDGGIIFWQSQYGGQTGYIAENTSRGGYDLVPNGLPLGGSSSSSSNDSSSNSSGSSSSGSSNSDNSSNVSGAYSGSCDEALPPSIPVGGRGHVPDDPNHQPTSLRSEPRLRDSNVIYEMPPFTQFTVTGDAVCIDSQRNGVWMVPVRLDDGTTGWTAYGYQGDIPWIAAVSSTTTSENPILIKTASCGVAAVDLHDPSIFVGNLTCQMFVTYSRNGNSYTIRTVTVEFGLDPVDQAQMMCYVVADVEVYNHQNQIIAARSDFALGILFVSEGQSQIDMVVWEEIGQSGHVTTTFQYSCVGGSTPPNAFDSYESEMNNLMQNDPIQNSQIRVNFP